MASFLSIFKKVGSIALGFEHIAAPIASVMFPEFSPIITGMDRLFVDLQGNIVANENRSPVGGGPAKAAATAQSFVDGLSVVQDILAAEGKTLTFDQGKLQQVITAQVAAFNAMSEVKASFKIVPK